MVADFEFIGNVGKVYYSDKPGTNFFNVSLATWNYYKKEKVTQWINNIYFFGMLAELADSNLEKGTLVRIRGKIKIKNKKGTKETEVYFIAGEFNVLTRGKPLGFSRKKLREEEIKHREEDDFGEEDYYNKPEVRDDPF